MEALSSYHLLILLLATLMTVTVIARAVLKAIAASRSSISRAEAAEVRAELAQVRERLAVMERLQVTYKDSLASEIEKLREE